MTGAFTSGRLGPSDVGTMRKVLALYAEAFEDRAIYLDAQPSDDYLRKLLGRADFIQLVGISEGQVAGALSAYVLQKFEQARSEIYIYDLAVARYRRRQGIAEALLERLRAIAREIGAWVVYVQADHGDDPAIALYTKLGEREDVLHFDIVP